MNRQGGRQIIWVVKHRSKGVCMNRSIAVIAAGALALGLAACGDDSSSADETTAPASTVSTTQSGDASQEAEQPRKRRRTTTLKLRNTRFGRILVDGKGRALYLFTREGSTRSRCYGQCAVAWPPFYARGKLRAGNGLDADKLGSSRRRDGRRIVTYNGHPLYYYVTDTKPGQVTCHDVVEFGGTWLVVNPAGNAVS
jgi:predicted lipoprotein with Yx(FWY)xxD motif